MRSEVVTNPMLKFKDTLEKALKRWSRWRTREHCLIRLLGLRYAMYEMTLAGIGACSQIAPQGNRVLHIHWAQAHEAYSVRVYDTDLHTSYVSNEQQEKLFHMVETGAMPSEYHELAEQIDCIDQ